MRRDRHVEKARQVLVKEFTRQRTSALSRLGDKSTKTVDDIFNISRENTRLRLELNLLANQTATDFGQALAAKHGHNFDPQYMANYLDESARISAESINQSTQDALDAALLAGLGKDGVAHVFDVLESATAPLVAETKTTSTANFGRTEAAKQLKLGTKTWRTTSQNPRASHAAIDGETVAVDSEFSIGGRWPGDPALDVAEVANCSCLLEYGG